MVVARTRKVSPVNRRRDRVEEVDEDETDDVDATKTAVRPRRTAKPARRVVTRPPVEDDDDDEEPDEDEDDIDEEEEEDEDEEDEEPAPRPRKKAAAKKTAPARRRPAAKHAAPPPGIHVGRKGAEEIYKSASGGQNRLGISNDPILVKFLEPEPFASFKQHWVGGGGKGKTDLPYTCVGGKDCPLCGVGDRPSAVIAYNVLQLSDVDEPENKILQIGIKADKALIEAATGRNNKLTLQVDFWSVYKSGKGNQTQTNFRPVKLRDIEDDWPELLEIFDIEDLDDLIADASENVFEPDIIQTSTRKQLSEVAGYLAGDEDDD